MILQSGFEIRDIALGVCAVDGDEAVLFEQVDDEGYAGDVSFSEEGVEAQGIAL